MFTVVTIKKQEFDIVDYHVTTVMPCFTCLIEVSNVFDTLPTQCQILMQQF